MTPLSRVAATAEQVQEWLKWIERLVDDEETYAQWSEKALRAGARYHPERLRELVGKFFAGVRRW